MRSVIIVGSGCLAVTCNKVVDSVDDRSNCAVSNIKHWGLKG